MGMGSPTSELSVPLLGGKPGVAIAVQPSSQAHRRGWNQGLLCCCGDCDYAGCASCLLARYCPCVAFGCACLCAPSHLLGAPAGLLAPVRA